MSIQLTAAQVYSLLERGARNDALSPSMQQAMFEASRFIANSRAALGADWTGTVEDLEKKLIELAR